jgi:outer membrane protein assembly factor BamB
MTVIELGETTWEETPSPGHSPRERRVLVIVLLAALCLAGLSASERPAPMGVQPLWSAPGTSENGTILTSDTAYLQEHTPDGTQVTAYELATGHRRWSLDLIGSIGYLLPAEQAGLLLAPADQQVVELEPGSPEPLAPVFHRDTMALDPRTGARRWKAAGEPVAVDRTTAMMMDYAEEGQPRRIRVIALSDGHTLWSVETRDVDAQTLAMTGDRPTALITVAKDGTTTTYRYADGVRTSRTRIPWVPGKRDNGYFNDIYAEGGKVVVNHAGPDGFDVRVYRLDTMTETWRISSESGYLVPCGALLCARMSGALAAWDLNGVKRWELPATDSIWPVGNDRIVLGSTGGASDTPVLIDAATGRRIGDSPTGYLVWTTEQTDSMLLLRAATSPANRTAIIRWDLRTGRHYVLGVIDRSAGLECQSVGNYLVCRRGPGTVEVTAVR